MLLHRCIQHGQNPKLEINVAASMQSAWSKSKVRAQCCCINAFIMVQIQRYSKDGQQCLVSWLIENFAYDHFWQFISHIAIWTPALRSHTNLTNIYIYICPLSARMRSRWPLTQDKLTASFECLTR